MPATDRLTTTGASSESTSAPPTNPSAYYTEVRAAKARPVIVDGLFPAASRLTVTERNPLSVDDVVEISFDT